MSSTNRIAARVAAAYLIANPRVAALVGDPKQLVESFALALQKLASSEDPQKLQSARGILEQEAKQRNSVDYRTVHDAQGTAYSAYYALRNLPLRASGYALFLSILQSYTLPPKLLKQVEMASREYLKSRPPPIPKLGPLRYLGALTAYEQVVALGRKHLEVAREAIAQGKEHGAEGEGATKVQVGPITIINTGGFSSDVMRGVADTIHQVVSHIQKAGFGQILYGDVHVTNTIKSNANVLAFYLVQKDEMFVRANVKVTTGMVRDVIHEYGHRYQHKFLRGGEKTLTQLYATIDRQEFRRRIQGPKESEKPTPGEVVEHKGTRYEAIKLAPGGQKVEAVNQKNKKRYLISLDSWNLLKRGENRDLSDPDHLGFVTEYAKRSPGENFAEMFSYYCIGKLPRTLVPIFEQALSGALL